MASPREPEQEEDEPIKFEVEGTLPYEPLPSVAIKRPMGRPPTYRAHFCEDIIGLGCQGYSQARMAAEIGVSKQTITDWSKQHKNFSDALTRARTLSQAYWERRGHDGLQDRNFNTSLWLGNMKSMFRDDYGDRVVNELVGKDGGPIQTESVTNPTELARRMAFALIRANADPAEVIEADGAA
jgi:transposase